MKEHIRRKGPIRQSAGDRAFNIVNAIVMTLITVVIVYPLLLCAAGLHYGSGDRQFRQAAVLPGIPLF